MNGLHLIGDLTGCRCDPQLLLEGEKFRAKCVELVEASGLTTVGVSFHQFEGSGFTGCLVLAERSEEHTSELQSQSNLVCRLLLEKKKEHHVLTLNDRQIIRMCHDE